MSDDNHVSFFKHSLVFAVGICYSRNSLSNFVADMDRIRIGGHMG